ncbi:MAG: endonuclease III [Peptostreptococcaceae bacterium]|jgi:endonuclease-3|nr:endonuclease III [Peptostreptococcaceae bacterium]
MTIKNIDKILDDLEKLHPNAKCELNHDSPFQLLIATILSAQSTDVKVNEVTKSLFKDYKNLNEFLNLDQETLISYIRSIGLYKNKSKNIINLCEILIDEYNGIVPDTMEELVKLPGVGRKTANVVLSNAFNIDGIAVDTHVFRVSKRIGIAKGDTVLKVEFELREKIKKSRWSKSHHVLIFHGRYICKSRKPECDKCNIKDYCDYYIQKN